jgi:hypothetical protein
MAKSPFPGLEPGQGVGYPSGQRGQTVNLLAYAFDGSNPSPTTTLFAMGIWGFLLCVQWFTMFIHFRPVRLCALAGFSRLSQNDARKVIKK